MRGEDFAISAFAGFVLYKIYDKIIPEGKITFTFDKHCIIGIGSMVFAMFFYEQLK